MFVCLFSVCPQCSNIYLHVGPTATQYMKHYTEHYDIISWSVHVLSFGEGEGEGGGGGAVRWGDVRVGGTPGGGGGGGGGTQITTEDHINQLCPHFTTSNRV